MNDNTILLGITILIADLFLIFAGAFNHLDPAHYGYYVFDAIIILGIAVGLTGVFLPPPKRKVAATA